MPDLFDMDLRKMRRDRAARNGPELFLLDRAFEDCVERIASMQRRFDRGLLIGCPDPGWPARVPADEVVVFDPGPQFAERAGGEVIIEDQWEPDAGQFDLVLAVGTLDTVNELPLALALIRQAMKPDGLFIGALSGGETLPQLRAAMRAGDAVAGVAAPHVHPRIEAASLAPLLEQAGFTRPVVDIDRAQVSYRSFAALVADLRAMGATNILTARPRRGLSKAALMHAAERFTGPGEEDRTTEVFEILHFAAWTSSNMVTTR